ncbi:MAG: DUF3137 domain-containing protein [Bacteroidota bacterium]
MNQTQIKALENKLEQLEAQRVNGAKKGRWTNRASKPFQFLFWAGAIVTFGSSVLPFLIFLLPFGVVALLIGLLAPRIIRGKKDPAQEYQAVFRKSIISWVLKEIYPSLVYQPKESISFDSTQASRLFGKDIAEVSGENKMAERETQFASSNLIVRKEKKSTLLEEIGDSVLSSALGIEDDMSDDGIELVKTFQGLLAMHKLDLATNGTIIFAPKDAQWTKPFIRSYKKVGQRIDTHDEGLNAAFDVYVTKGILVEKILSPEIVQYILHVRQHLASSAAFSLRAGHLFVAIPSNRKWFDPDLQQSIGSLQDFDPYMDQIDKIWKLRFVPKSTPTH